MKLINYTFNLSIDSIELFNNVKYLWLSIIALDVTFIFIISVYIKEIVSIKVPTYIHLHQPLH